MNKWLKFKAIPDEAGSLISNNRRYKIVNEEIELLHKKIEAQDKIINTQALEIARLKEQLEILLEDNSQLEEIRIKAIEYIQKRFEINEYGEYYFTHTFDNSNMKELLEILGDKENVKN